MPGPYAHITLVNELVKIGVFNDIFSQTPDALPALLEFFSFCELGSVSPDYPNLAFDDSNAAQWADAMHYTHTGKMIQKGIRHVKSQDGDSKRKMLAWLLGYTAHVVTDVTIHPVVRLQVGDYAENKRQHRICEMHQDAHVFQRLGLGEVGRSRYLNVRVAECGDAGNSDRLDREIAALWSGMCREVHPELYAANPPDMDEWHMGFCAMDAAGIEEGHHLFPLARVIATRNDQSYPAHDGTDRQFIDNLRVPVGDPMSYDAIFDKAIEHVGEIWGVVARGVYTDDTAYLSRFGEWDLDTGQDANGRLVFWG